MWYILSADGDFYCEDWSDYSGVLKIVNRGENPDDVEEVIAFDMPLSTGDLKKWICLGRYAARKGNRY